MAIVSLCCMFIGFMGLVVWHDIQHIEHYQMTGIDTIYFWLVTFTTVGFGDVHLPLSVEIHHFYEVQNFLFIG